MVPLAKILGDATEELAACLQNDMLSGLLNATFGNAVEMIMTINLLINHEYLVVKCTLLGSMLSNMLLVLGMSFLAGGLTRSSSGSGTGSSEPLLNTGESTIANKQQRYSTLGALINSTMLLLACLLMGLITVFDYVDDINDDGKAVATEEKMYMLPISRICSMLTISAYVAFIVFQLFTHKDAMSEADEDEGEEAALTLSCSLMLLVGATVVVAVCSEFLTDALEGALEGAPIGKYFLGIVLLPIVGNACEHAAAIRFAIQDKAGLSVGIAVGSSVQIALLVTPFSVLAGWAIGNSAQGTNMDLNFGALNIAVLTFSTLVLLSIVLDGKSNWLEGYMLCTAYCIIAVLYWYVPDN
eukprot:gnl/TRDRNA2_/TRDRNA2_163667_c0_seq2.p1 gnl/TRDRNA2_/TRDRNA2_163667_c0~~gnl/TRDRNA2_/TRDRNA2_163667_c0_seq2.p1  ORF type:complete len:400 (-),score=87.83 gnl/TRDRNA2_/TRDRNA2_163667_c0_seq2:97-1164(-)